MKIAELLNVAAAEPMGAAREPPLVHRRMDMASLDQFALQQQQQQQAAYQTKETRPTANLSMSRIIQELEASGGEPKLQPATVDVRPPAVSADEQSPPPASKSTKTSGSTTKAKGTTARPRGRRSRAGCTPLTESEKRVKQRQLVKKSYYRKIDTLNELRGQVEALEHEFHTVLRTTGSATSPPDSPPTLRAKFAQLALDQDELRRENEQLRASAMDQAKARTRIGILLGEELRDHEAVAARLAKDAAVLADDDMAVYPQDPQADSPMEDAVHGQDSLMTVRDCLAVHREAVAQVRAFVASERFESSGARVFGWRDRRRVDGDTMHFLLEKTHRGVDAETLGDRMWTLASSMDGLKRLYMSPIPTEFQFIQRVDDHNVLFLRHMHVVDAVGRRSLLRSLVLVSLIEVDTGFLLLYRSVDHDRFLPEREKTIVTKGETVVWTDVFSWGLYERAGPRDCRNTFGGFVSALTSTRSIDFWLMQILVIAVRCESEVIGPLFLLGSGEAATNQHDDDDDDPKDQPM